MPDITGISLALHGSTVLFFILLIAGLLTIYGMYRRTIPPARLRTRIVLAALRIGALVAIIGLFFTPVLTLSFEQRKKPVIVVALDTSGSMSIVDIAASGEQIEERDGTASRGGNARELLQSPEMIELSKDFNIRFYAFNRLIEEFSRDEIDSITFTGEGTDIAAILNFAADQTLDSELRGILLLSDGSYNRGENPVTTAEDRGIPVIPIGIGDPIPQRDVLISNIQVNEIAYAGTNVPVTVSVQSTGYENAMATVVLTADGEMLDSGPIRLAGNYRERSITLNFTPSEAKVQKLQVSVSPQENEVSTRNNRREFFVKILETKLNIFIAAGRPSMDYAFLKRSLEENENYSVTGIVQKAGGYYSSGFNDIISSINAAHAFMLVDFPAGPGIDNLLRAIRREVTVNKKPVMYISGQSLSSSQLQPLVDILLLRSVAARGKEAEVYVRLAPPALEHPVFAVSDDPGVNRALWEKLPPVFTPGMIPVPDQNAAVMVKVDIVRSPKSALASTTPLVFLNRIEERKILFFNVYNVWRWKLMALRDTDIAGFYDTLMNNCVRWLVNKEDTKLFHVTTNKEFYRNGERVVINAQVYTPNYDPVDDAEVQVTVRKPGTVLNRLLQSIGKGRYSTTLEILEPGEYTVTGEALRENRNPGRDSADFVIGQFSVELLRTAMNGTLLAQVASVSGGTYLTPGELYRLPDLLDDSSHVVSRTVDIEIWNKAWLLTAIIALLCLEWFLRKRLGML